MGDKSAIEWTDATWNPVVGCTLVSPGCTNCYAMREAHRLGERLRLAKYEGLTRVVNDKPVWNGVVRLHPAHLDQPRRWKRPRLIFVNSMSDLGHPDLSHADRALIVRVMADADQHVYQVLTKRPLTLLNSLVRMDEEGAISLPREVEHVWWGVSVEDQARADQLLPIVHELAAWGLRVWVSYEPAVGPVDWTGWEGISGIVCGGESGPDARPMHPDWARATRDWADRNSIPFDFKQWGEWAPCFTDHPEDGSGIIIVPVEEAVETKMSGRYSITSAHQHEFFRIGKKKAGRELDGVVWDGFTSACRAFLPLEDMPQAAEVAHG